ncbi:MAG TPA: hypothetical protein VFT30_04265 [Nitrospira sp.]|nr:hypothetical protein [Nitrospira sp.]
MRRPGSEGALLGEGAWESEGEWCEGEPVGEGEHWPSEAGDAAALSEGGLAAEAPCDDRWCEGGRCAEGSDASEGKLLAEGGIRGLVPEGS